MCGTDIFRYACGHEWKQVTEDCTLKSASLPLREITNECCKRLQHHDDWGAVLEVHCGRNECAELFQIGWRQNEATYCPKQRPGLARRHARFSRHLKESKMKNRIACSSLAGIYEAVESDRGRERSKIISVSMLRASVLTAKGNEISETPGPAEKGQVRTKKLRKCTSFGAVLEWFWLVFKRCGNRINPDMREVNLDETYSHKLKDPDV